MYETDMALYQTQMAIKLLTSYEEKTTAEKEKIKMKFKKFGGQIDEYFKNACLETELAEVKMYLDTLNSNRLLNKLEDTREHERQAINLFRKSLDQQFYNVLISDREEFQTNIKNFLLVQQLKYEKVLTLPDDEIVTLMLRQIDRIKGFTESYWFVKLESLGEVSKSEIRKHSLDSKVSVQELSSPGKLGPRNIMSRRTVKDIKTKLAPLFIFEMKNKIIVDSCISLLFDSLDLEYDDNSKVYSNLRQRSTCRTTCIKYLGGYLGSLKLTSCVRLSPMI